MPTFVTDRTKSDVDRWKTLAAKGWGGMTAAEREEWMNNPKGAYNASDFNRVGAAMNEIVSIFATQRSALADYLAGLGVAEDESFTVPYNPATLNWTQKDDWPRGVKLSREELAQYLSRVKLLRSCFDSEAPQPPDSMLGLKFDGANAIEEALRGTLITGTRWYSTTRDAALRTSQAWYYSGDLYAGEV